LITWSYDRDSGISLQAVVEKSVPSFRREKEDYKAMYNHPGTIWQTAAIVNRHSGPKSDSHTVTGTLHAGQHVTILCYSKGSPESFENPLHTPPTSDAWDFVVTGDQDLGSFVADVFIDTGGDIRQQLGSQGTCDALCKRLGGTGASALG